ncbi:13176_t:CDS:2, partial [Acaulospora colombiana]
DLARNQHGDIHLALSGPAAQLLFQEAGLDSSQFRHRMMSRYATRTGRPSSREGGLSPSMTTAQRWAEEIRVNAGPAFENRLSEMENHVIRRLLPAARETARLQAEEVARQRKEAEEKAKAEREAQEKAEAEEKARLEAEAALAEQQRQEAEAKPPEPEENATMVEQESIPSSSNQDTAGSEPLPSTGDPTTAEASSSQRPRVTVMYQGESVDITDADIDPEFLNAVPEEIRDEIIGNFVREQRQTRPPRASEAEMDMEFLNALPAELREDVLRGQTYARMAEAVDMDAASVLATLPEELRQTVLLEQLDQDHAFLETMPSSILAEANALRAQRDSRRPLPGISVVNQTIPPPATRKIQYRETAQLLDKSGLVHLVRLLFFLDQNRRASLQQVLVNLSENNRSRIDLLSILLTLLNSNKIDLNAVDRSFSQLSVRGVKSNSKGKQRDDSITAGTLGDKPPEEHVVIQRTLDTLSAVVQANESASMFFLTEQDHAQGLQRSVSKKGKGKERPVAGPHYPFVQLLSLLERPNLVQQAHSLDAISGLLCTITKPLAVLREPPRSDDHSPKTIVPTIQDPSRPHATAEATSSPTRAEGEVNTLQTPNEPVQLSEEVKSSEPTPPTREDILRSKPPQFPEHSLRLVVNLLTMGECSSRCFQNTQTLVFNLSSLPYARDVITQELKTKAEEFGHIIQNELDVLLRAVHHLKKGEELPSGITTKFSLPTSNQAKLLRILKILEN